MHAGTRFSGTPALFAFRDMDYFALISPIGWTPAAYEIAEIIVPRGFVTDFASVPRLFWSMLPPIGRYGYAAIFHDFAYWQQTARRDEADKLFHETMIELAVGRLTRNVLYYSVRLLRRSLRGATMRRPGQPAKSASFANFPMTSRPVGWTGKSGRACLSRALA